MASNHVIKFAVTKKQKQKIIDDANKNGHLTISDYMRELTLRYELNNQIKKIVKELTNENNKRRMDREIRKNSQRSRTK
ncbi:hypothetical protein ACFLZN_02385 [Nanoarchaeota archaeon]